MANTMTLGEYFKEAEAYEYSKEYFDIIKETTELDLIALYLENYDYMQERIEYGEEIHESAMFTEATEEVKKGFFKRIWDGILKILKALVKPFMALYTFLKNIFINKEAEEKKRIAKAEKLIAKREEDIEKWKANEDEKVVKSRKELNEDREADMERLVKLKEEEKKKNAEIQAKIVSYIGAFKSSERYRDIYKWIVSNEDDRMSSNTAMGQEAVRHINNILDNRVEDKECHNIIRKLNVFRFSMRMPVPRILTILDFDLFGGQDTMFKKLNHLVLEYTVNQTMNRDAFDILKDFKNVNKTLADGNFDAISMMDISEMLEINNRIAKFANNINDTYEKMKECNTESNHKKEEKDEFAKYSVRFKELFQVISEFYKNFMEANLKIKNTIDKYNYFKHVADEIIDKVLLILNGNF